MKIISAESVEGKDLVAAKRVPRRLSGNLYLTVQEYPSAFYTKWGLTHSVIRHKGGGLIDPYVVVNAELRNLQVVESTLVGLIYLQEGTNCDNCYTAIALSLYGESGVDELVGALSDFIAPGSVSVYDSVQANYNGRHNLSVPIIAELSVQGRELDLRSQSFSIVRVEYD